MLFAQILKEKVVDVFFSFDHELFNQSLFFLYPLYFLAATTNPLSSFLQLFDQNCRPFWKLLLMIMEIPTWGYTADNRACLDQETKLSFSNLIAKRYKA